MRSRLPAGKGRLPCCTTLLPFTSGARPAQLSARPRPHTPGWAWAAAGGHSFAAGSLTDMASMVGRAGWGTAPGPVCTSGPNCRRSGTSPPCHSQPSSALGWQAGNLQAPETETGKDSYPCRHPGVLFVCVCVGSFCGRPLRPLGTLIKTHRIVKGSTDCLHCKAISQIWPAGSFSIPICLSSSMWTLVAIPDG